MKPAPPAAPPLPRIRLSLGITGHRASHPLYAANAARIDQAIGSVLDTLADAVAAEPEPFGPGSIAPVRLHSLLAGGADQVAAREAVARGWDVVAPLPFGADLNCAINAGVKSPADAEAIIAGGAPQEAAAAVAAREIRDLYAKARLFELADDDDEMTDVFLATLAAPEDAGARNVFAADCSERVALAGRLLIEQSDILIAVWDGRRTTMIGGTGHTILRALELGAPVVWIDPGAPEAWRILRAPETLASLRAQHEPDDRGAQLQALVRGALRPVEPAQTRAHHGVMGDHPGVSALEPSHWRARSNPLWHAYRRVEAVFGGEKGRSPWRSLRQTYETPEAIISGSGSGMLDAARALPGGDPDYPAAIGRGLGRFAWADAISSRLSDTYRGGMMINFMLSSFAIVGGIAYIPFADSNWKWAFALFEFVLLASILVITGLGQKRRWHGRWFETRRVAEYLRHAPLLLALGAARAPGRWPQGAETSWPEWYARHALREAGLPRAKVTADYLRHALSHLLDAHVVSQRDYHFGKSRRLTKVHHNLDQLSEWMFRLAVLSVVIYLGFQIAYWLHAVEPLMMKSLAKVFTFLGVLLPTFGGAIAGIRYFGDFERFAAISEVTAQKLDSVHGRIVLLLKAPDVCMDYGPVAEIAHAADDIVVSEIESWQAVFGGKQITVPV